MDAGERLEPYQILSAIGQGDMGEVYRAPDTKLGRDVAIKILPAEVTGDAESLFEIPLLCDRESAWCLPATAPSSWSRNRPTKRSVR